MPCDTRHLPLFRPSPITVHDDSDMVGRLTVKTHINTPSFDPLGDKIPLVVILPEAMVTQGSF